MSNTNKKVGVLRLLVVALCVLLLGVFFVAPLVSGLSIFEYATGGSDLVRLLELFKVGSLSLGAVMPLFWIAVVGLVLAAALSFTKETLRKKGFTLAVIAGGASALMVLFIKRQLGQIAEMGKGTISAGPAFYTALIAGLALVVIALFAMETLTVKRVRDMLSSGKQNMVIILAAVVLFLAFYMINPGFAKSGNLLTMTKSFVPYAILALGVTFVIATGGIDLSIGTVCIGSAVLAGALCGTGVRVTDGNLALTIPIILATGLVFGLINGFLVAKCKIAPFIATLGTMMVSRGLTSVVAEAVRKTSSAVKYPTTGWLQKIFTNYEGFPIGLIWVLGLTILCMIVMYKTKIGRYILAIGSNEEAARLSGINTDKYKIIAYAICGMFAGMAALFYMSANPSLTIASGNGMELDAVAGTYIGGTSTTGGSASVIGTILGSMILVIIRQGLNLTLSGGKVPFSATNITYAVTGVIVVGAVMLDVLKKKSAAKVKVPTEGKKGKKGKKCRCAKKQKEASNTQV